MKIVCDNCSTKYSIADEKVRGKVFKIKCKKCSHIIVVKGDVAPEGSGGFDQKDTRVFDYSGFDGGRDGGAAAAAQDAIWHLVIDREQVGPLTIAEVQAKVTSGEADAETYVWREGFGDWQRLGSVDELAELARPREEAGPGTEQDKGLFGKGGPADLFGAAKTEEAPADLFSGATETRPSPEPVVFSSTGRTQKPAKEDLFGSADAMAAAPGEGGGGRAMTAQRNENSVLFSLNNLASLATDSPKPTVSAGGGGGGAGPSPGGIMGSTNEGSGLIDIRAMAAMTLSSGGKKEERAMPAASNDDDLPVFSASAFSAPASGVLLPTVTSSSSSNRMIYMLVGFVAVLALAAIGLVVFILTGKKDVVAVAPPVETPREPAATPTPPPMKQAVVAPTEPTATPPPSPSPTPTPPPTAPNATPPTATPPTVTPTPGKPPEKKPKPIDKPKDVAKAPTPVPAPPKEEKPPEPPPPPKTAKCDEVACLVTPDLPCCPKRGGDKPKDVAAAGNLPEQLDQPDIIAGMKVVAGKVTGCNDTYRVAGAFKIKVTVGPDGNVTAATAQPPMAGTPTGSCVEKAVRAAKFKKTKRAITFNYPYNFH